MKVRKETRFVGSVTASMVKLICLWVRIFSPEKANGLGRKWACLPFGKAKRMNMVIQMWIGFG